MWEQYKHIIGHIEVGSGVLDGVPKWIAQKGFCRPLLVMDVNTRRVAGQRLCALMDAAGIAYDTLVYDGAEPLCADESAIGALLAAYTPENGLIAGVGSGTINDLCKFVARKVGRLCIAIGTAPSMDGYASAGAAMTLGGMKVTPHMQCPEAIFCDLDILKDAPMPMIAAGMGDVLGKLSALADWRLSHLLTGEPMPSEISDLVANAVKRCQDSVDGALARSADAISSITEALILSGIAMSLYGDSRPASGTEHHLSHYWEMRFIMENKPPVLHGLKVGVATITALALWKSLPELPTAPPPEDRQSVLKAVARAYGKSAPALMAVENPNLPFERIMKHWPEIKAIADSVPQPEYLAGLLGKLGAPLTPADIGVDDTMMSDGILLARERKKTYTLLQLLGDLGLLEQASGMGAHR